MRKTCFVILAVGVLLISSGFAGSQPPAGKKDNARKDSGADKSAAPDPAVDAWVQELVSKATHKNKTISDAAALAIVGVGNPALPALKKLAEGTDRDLAATAQGLIGRVENAPRFGFGGGPGPGGPGGRGPGGPGGGGFGGPGGGPGGGGFGGPGGGFGGRGGGFGQAPAARLDDVKKEIASTNEEWKVIRPKLEKVIAAQQIVANDIRGTNNANMAMGGFGGPGGGFGGPGGPGGGFGGPGGGPGGGFGGQRGGPGGGPGGGFGGGGRRGGQDAPSDAPPKKDSPPAKGPEGEGPATAPPANGAAPSASASMPVSAVAQAQADLKAVLKTSNHSSSQIKDKIEAIRQAREKAKAQLVAAQKDLMLLLTDDQQAVLVSLGYLD